MVMRVMLNAVTTDNAGGDDYGYAYGSDNWSWVQVGMLGNGGDDGQIDGNGN